MPDYLLSPDTQAILLLCGIFGKSDGDAKPLTLRQYNELAAWLHERDMRPRSLLSREGAACVEEASKQLPEGERILRLLDRGAALALAVERWTNIGLWVISRADKTYPRHLRNHLVDKAPPILYGVGDVRLLDRGGLAVVGSRNADTGALRFTRRVADRCASESMQIISGGARGIDQEAMLTAIRHEGTAVGVLSDNLEKKAVSKEYRTALKKGMLTLISPYYPSAPFSVGNAMGRNKLIYTLADFSLVISSAAGEGGTWLGAIENLKKGWVPLFVRDGDQIPEGNEKLIAQGGIAFSGKQLSLSAQLDALYTISTKLGREEDEETPTITKAEVETQKDLFAISDFQSKYNTAKSAEKDISQIFWDQSVWPLLKQILSQELSEKSAAKKLDLQLGQARAWLKKGIEEGKIKKLTKPVRYTIVDDIEDETQLSLI